MKVEQLSLADYNKIKNIPVVNQDLSASGFTPVANTYYRHTGTTGTYKQGVIYYYDGTEYKALDGSGGGGTTLNKYTYTLQFTGSDSAGVLRLRRIVMNAKSITGGSILNLARIGNFAYEPKNKEVFFYGYRISPSSDFTIFTWTFSSDGTIIRNGVYLPTNGTINVYGNTKNPSDEILRIEYYNDTEIT